MTSFACYGYLKDVCVMDVSKMSFVRLKDVLLYVMDVRRTSLVRFVRLGCVYWDRS